MACSRGLWKISCYGFKNASSLKRSHSLFASRKVSTLVDNQQYNSTVDIAGILRDCLPDMHVSSNPYDCAQHGKGESFHTSLHNPAVVAYPRCTADVQTIVAQCMRYRIPLVAFGAGTSLEGHVNALYKNTLSLDMTLLQKIELHDKKNHHSDDDKSDGGSGTTIVSPVVTVGAGVRRHQLNDALRHTGLHFTVDPGADATIGGMVATGASGTTTIRYGTMRDNILGLTCVVPATAASAAVADCNFSDKIDNKRNSSMSSNAQQQQEQPTLVHAGTRGGALKNSAGYDLLSLFCGSEGTLGVITEITLKLHPRPEHVVAATCTFPSLHSAAQAVANLQLLTGGGDNLGLTRCELLDTASIQAFNDYNNKDDHNGVVVPSRSVQPTLFLELQGCSETSLKEQVALCEAICRQEDERDDSSNMMTFELAWEANARHALWKARHSLYYAVLASRWQTPPPPPPPSSSSSRSNSSATADDAATSMSGIVTDACVPIAHLADIITATSDDAKAMGLFAAPCFGHAGVSRERALCCLP
jgi:D-lactate dehydrogenase (cytochrome)